MFNAGFAPIEFGEAVIPQTGVWSAVYDSGQGDAKWGHISWNAAIPADSGMEVFVSAGANGVNFSGPVRVENLAEFNLTGRYIKIEVNLRRSSGGESPVVNSLTVTAKSDNNNDYYNVVFLDWDGAVLKTQSVTRSLAATAPTAPDNKTGWHFVGWDVDFSNVTEDLIVTALYEINYYNVTFLWTDGTTVLAETSVAYDGIIDPAVVPQFCPDNINMILSWLLEENGDPFDLGTNIHRDYRLIPGEIEDYNYRVYLTPEKTAYTVGDTLLVDVMLVGNLSYTQIMTEITFDSALLRYESYEDLSGLLAVCAPTTSGSIAMRSVPTTNVIAGASCSPAVKIVTLEFKVLGNFAGDSIDTALGFGFVQVNSPANYIGATTAPRRPVIVGLNKE
jgi:hypothetical protein